MGCQRTLVNGLIIATIILSTSSALAKDEKSSKDNKSTKTESAIGSKELLSRIEQLEAALAALQPIQASVAGSTYATFVIVGGFGLLNAPNQGHFQTVGSRVRTFQFNTDNTGTWTLEDCVSEQLSEFGTAAAQIQSSPGCNVPTLTHFTYTQTGNIVEVTPAGAPASLLLTVSQDGNVLGNAQGGAFGNPAIPGGINGVSTSMILGLRIGN